MGFRDPEAVSSALTALGMLQHQAFGPVDPLVSLSNYYVIPAPPMSPIKT